MSAHHSTAVTRTGGPSFSVQHYNLTLVVQGEGDDIVVSNINGLGRVPFMYGEAIVKAVLEEHTAAKALEPNYRRLITTLSSMSLHTPRILPISLAQTIFFLKEIVQNLPFGITMPFLTSYRKVNEFVMKVMAELLYYPEAVDELSSLYYFTTGEHFDMEGKNIKVCYDQLVLAKRSEDQHKKHPKHKMLFLPLFEFKALPSEMIMAISQYRCDMSLMHAAAQHFRSVVSLQNVQRGTLPGALDNVVNGGEFVRSSTLPVIGTTKYIPEYIDFLIRNITFKNGEYTVDRVKYYEYRDEQWPQTFLKERPLKGGFCHLLMVKPEFWFDACEVVRSPVLDAEVAALYSDWYTQGRLNDEVNYSLVRGYGQLYPAYSVYGQTVKVAALLSFYLKGNSDELSFGFDVQNETLDMVLTEVRPIVTVAAYNMAVTTHDVVHVAE